MQGLKVGEHVDRRHHEEDIVATVDHSRGRGSGKREEFPRSAHDDDHMGRGGGFQRRPSPNDTSGSGGNNVSSSEWLHQQQCSGVMSVRVLGLPPATPPSLEMSLGRQGWQMDQQCGGEFEFEPSPPSAAKELTLLRCL